MARAGPEKVVRPCQDDIRLVARFELKQLWWYINLDLSFKISDVSERFDSEFYCPKKKKKGKARWSYDKMLID